METTRQYRATQCPSQGVLLAYCSGRLPEFELETVDCHLSTCEACLAFLDSQHHGGKGANLAAKSPILISELESAKSSLLDDTAFERIRGDAELQRMKVRAKAIKVDDDRETATFDSPPPGNIESYDAVDPIYIGPYFVVRRLGRGGFADVYLATDPKTGEHLAIKVPRKLKGEEQVKEFLAEARKAAGLNHPSIVRVYGFDRLPDGGCYVAMKYIKGRSLETAMQSERFSFERTAELCAQIADALEYVHQAGYVHRDIKPANILLDQNDQPYVADFGLAIHEDVQYQYRDQRAGTWPYMSPEQIAGESQLLDGRSDVWSLGVIMYELLTRQKPFPSKNKQVLEEQIQRGDPKPPQYHNPQIPLALADICLNCLETDRRKRCPASAVLAEKLRRACQLSQPSAELSKPISARSRFAYWLPALGTLALVACLFAVWLNLPQDRIPGRWYALLDHQPEALVISEIAPDSSWQYDRKRQEVMIGSSHPVVLGVGEISSNDFRLEVKVVKSTWQGDAGIAWGIHEVESEGMPALRYQVLFIHSHLKNGVMKYSLIIHHMESRFPPGGKAPRSSRFGYDECELPDAPDATEIPLEIQVIGGQLRSVMWHGKYVAGISDGPAMEPASPLVSRGKVGLFNETGSTIFRDFRIQILPPAIQHKRK